MPFGAIANSARGGGPVGDRVREKQVLMATLQMIKRGMIIVMTMANIVVLKVLF